MRAESTVQQLVFGVRFSSCQLLDLLGFEILGSLGEVQ